MRRLGRLWSLLRVRVDALCGRVEGVALVPLGETALDRLVGWIWVPPWALSVCNPEERMLV